MTIVDSTKGFSKMKFYIRNKRMGAQVLLERGQRRKKGLKEKTYMPSP